MENLGRNAVDKITGFAGTITGVAHYLYGCKQYVLVPRVDSEGKTVAGEWFDAGRITLLYGGIEPADVAGPTPGGPNRDSPK